MPAHVVKRAQPALGVTHDKNLFPGDVRGEIRTRRRGLVGAADDLPGIVEDGPAFQGRDFRVGVPRSGNRPGALQGQLAIESGQFGP